MHILDVAEVGGSPAEWTKVSLADGTVLEVTADHLLKPVSEDGQDYGPFQGALSPAAGLRPGRDSLLVLKAVPVPVQSVERCSQKFDSRISLTVNQPERHSIFIGPPGQCGGMPQTVAVESADAVISNVQMVVDHTFLSVDDTDESSHKRRRTRSAPAILRHSARDDEAVHSTGGHSPMAIIPTQVRALPSTSSSMSCSTSRGSDEEPAEVIVFPGSHSSVSVSSVLRVWAAGWRSAGSASHGSSSGSAVRPREQAPALRYAPLLQRSPL